MSGAFHEVCVLPGEPPSWESQVSYLEHEADIVGISRRGRQKPHGGTGASVPTDSSVL